MHPLAEDYSTLTDVQLQEKLTKIQKILIQGAATSVAQQALLIRESLIAEQQRRNIEALEKLNKDRKLPDVIDIS
jgi:hypothetical protein